MTASAPRTTEAGVAEPEPDGTAAVAADATLAVPVWDLPVRLVHWAFVALIAFSWWSAEYGEIEWHLRSGFTLMFLLLFRILWGFLGSSTARFGSFVTGPRRVLAYLRDPSRWHGAGHSPLGALSVVALLGLMLLQVGLGLLLSDEDGVIAGPLNRLVDFETAEWAHEIHELLFNVLLGFIALHVAAILFYRWRGQRLVRAMVTGRSDEIAEGAPAFAAAPRSRLLLCLALAGGITAWVASGVPGL